MRRQKLTIVLAALAATLVVPSSSVAEYYVPPANSAANQYTESVPGAGGESGGKRRDVHPNATLGADNAKRLEEQGKVGKEAAEVAAETAPAQLVDSGGSSQSSTGNGNSSGNGADPSKGGGGKGGNGSDSSDETESGGGSPSAGGSNGGQGTGGSAQQPEGSSGIGQVLGQATGASDGNLNLWLPLAIVLMLVGAVAYGVRTRQVQPGHRV
ncbi:MAG TPA: hypothetical protein VI039_04765 [Solirubrobacterales bacterium]